MSNRFTSLKDISANSQGRVQGYTTNASKLYGGVFGDSLSFPQELGTPEFNHYIVFFINELMGGSYVEQAKRRLSTDSPVFYQANSKSNAKMIADVTGGSNEGLLNMISPKYERTAVCIALPVPEVLTSRHESNWQTEDSMAMNLVALGGDMFDRISEDGVFSALTQLVGRQTVKTGAKLAANAMGNSGNQFTKTSTNTRRELMFDGVMPRRFSFTWTFYPKTPNESKALWDIVQMFKYHMLGEYDVETSGLFINFPNTFDIEVHSNGKRNNWLPKTSTCALASMDLNYTPGGSYAFFEEMANGKEQPDGAAPVGISISLEFAEIEIIYRNRLDPEFFTGEGAEKKPYMFGNSKEFAQRPDGGTF